MGGCPSCYATNQGCLWFAGVEFSWLLLLSRCDLLPGDDRGGTNPCRGLAPSDSHVHVGLPWVVAIRLVPVTTSVRLTPGPDHMLHVPPTELCTCNWFRHDQYFVDVTQENNKVLCSLAGNAFSGFAVQAVLIAVFSFYRRFEALSIASARLVLDEDVAGGGQQASQSSVDIA